MKTFTVSKLVAFAALVMACSTSHAALISGSLDYNENASGFSFSPTKVTFNLPNPDGTVNDATGDLAGLVGNTVNHTDLVYNPFAPTLNLFNTSGGFSFVLTEVIAFNYQVLAPGVEFVNIVGKGVGSLLGYDDTNFIWTFTATEFTANPNASNYAAVLTPISIPVPDSGTTLALLGAALALFAIVRRQTN